MNKRGQNRGFSLCNFSSKNRRGLSTIIVTLILIVVSLVAVAIFWVVVRNLLQTGTEGIGIGRYTLSANIKNVNLDNSTNNVSLTVERNPGQGEINGIEFIFSDGTDSEVVKETISMKELESRKFYFHLTKLNVSKLISISIAFLIKQDNTETLGDVVDRYNVKGGGGGSSGTTCTPSTCLSFGYSCGSWSDGCGGTLSCGNCSSGMTCNSSGRCQAGGCIPSPTCSALGFNCGTPANGTCSGNLNCGTCQTGYSCSNSSGGTCVCVPTTCSSLGYNCGIWSNGTCAGTLNCGICTGGQMCTNGICASSCAPATCTSLGHNCGTWNNGSCSGTLNCGTCGTGQTCNASGMCQSGSCTPTTCLALGYNCGTWNNGSCSGSLNCGSCSSGYACVGGSCVVQTGKTCEATTGHKCWYVDSSATGSNNGSNWVNAWTSLSGINWNSVNPGDFVYISGGSTSKTYTQTLNVGKSGSSGLPITIRPGQDAGYNGVVIIRGSTSYAINVGSSRSYLTFNGEYNGQQHIRITNTTQQGIYSGPNCNHLIFTYLQVDHNGAGASEVGGIWIDMNVDEPNTVIAEISYSKIGDNANDQIRIVGPVNLGNMYGRFSIHHNEIYNLQDDGAEWTAGGVDFFNNEVHGMASTVTGHPDGVQALNGYARVYNNKFYEIQNPSATPNSYIFIDFWNGEADTGHVRVYNNLMYHTQAPIGEDDYVRGMAIKAETNKNSVTDLIVANNIVVGMPAWGMTIDLPTLSTNCIFENNIFYNTYTLGSGEALTFEYQSATYGSHGDNVGIIIDYNLINAGPSGRGWAACSGCQDHGLTSNPLLSSTYHLQSGSPAINNGVSESTYFTTDLEGISRPQGSAWDIGAYEYH